MTALLTFGIGMILCYGNREHYFKKLEEYFPELKKQYTRKYVRLMVLTVQIIKKFCKENDVIYSEKEVF